MAKAIMGMGDLNELPAGPGLEGNDDDSARQSPLIGVDDDDTGFGDDDEDKEDPELDELFKAFNADEDEDGDEDEEEDDSTSAAEAGQALETDIRNMIKGMRLPDDAIPEDFDPSDRTQMHNLLQTTLRNTVAQSLNVVFKPVQFAMAQMAKEINSSIDQRISTAREGISEQSLMEQQLPEISNPKYAPMINSMNETLKSKGRKPAERVKAIRKILNQMGIKDGGRGAGTNRQSSGQSTGSETKRTGKAALDSIFGGAFNPPSAKKKV